MTGNIAMRLSAASMSGRYGIGPSSQYHFCTNNNFSGPSGTFDPNLLAMGFNVADCAPSRLSLLPPTVTGMVWIGDSKGTTYQGIVNSCVSNASKVWGFYLADTADPDPTGTWGTYFDPVLLQTQVSYIHSAIPTAKTFMWLANLGSNYAPQFKIYKGYAGYTPSNTGIDYFGISGYCAVGDLTNGYDLSIIGLKITAAQAAGIPLAAIVPTYQAFGGGSWGRPYQMPTDVQTRQMFEAWRVAVPNPVIDETYSWGKQFGDTALIDHPELWDIYRQHNKG